MVVSLHKPDDALVDKYADTLRKMMIKITNDGGADWQKKIAALTTAFTYELAHLVAFMADGSTDTAAKNLQNIGKELPVVTSEYMQCYRDVKAANDAQPDGRKQS